MRWYGWLCLVVGLWGCEAKTSGVKIQFQASAVGAMSDGKPVGAFENRQGWKVTLEKAHFLFGPVVFYEGKPRVAWWRGLPRWGVAYADPGHVTVDNRKVLAEVREQYVLDLLKGEALDLGKRSGIEGTLESVELQLLPPAGGVIGALAEMEGVTFSAIGQAEKAGEIRKFHAKLTIPEGGTQRSVQGIEAEVPLSAAKVTTGRLEVRIFVDRLLGSVDFGELSEKGEGERYALNEKDGGIVQGIRSRYSYGVVWR